MKIDCPAICLAVLFSVAAVLVVPGCGKDEPAPKPATAGAASEGHAREEGDGHDHGQDEAASTGDDHGHGATIALGEQSAGGFAIRASRDGDVKAGGEAPIDVWVTGGTAKVSAVRFWIGTQDAKGSMKAKASLERDNWHTHVEVPSPLTSDSRLWVEVETESREKFVAGFDLKG